MLKVLFSSEDIQFAFLYINLRQELRRVWRYQRVIRIRISKNSQHKVKLKEYKRTKNDQQNNTHQTKDRVTRTPLTTGGELRCSRRIISSCSTRDIRRVNLVTNPVISHEWGLMRNEN
jgi:hypothetical protein